MPDLFSAGSVTATPYFCQHFSPTFDRWCSTVQELVEWSWNVMAAMNGKLGDKAPQPINIRTVALAARVSMATVSRAINRVATVDPELAKRVWQVVDELGYVRNTQARALVSGRSRILGLIVSDRKSVV